MSGWSFLSVTPASTKVHVSCKSWGLLGAQEIVSFIRVSPRNVLREGSGSGQGEKLGGLEDSGIPRTDPLQGSPCEQA